METTEEDALVPILQKVENDVVDIKTSLYFLMKLQNILSGMQPKRQLKSTFMSMLLHSHYRIAVVDLVSLAKDLYSNTGFVTQMTQHRARLHKPNLDGPRVTRASDGTTLLVQGRPPQIDMGKAAKLFLEASSNTAKDMAFERLFPDAKSHCASSEDLARLKGHIKKQVKDVKAARDRYYAHRYDIKKPHIHMPLQDTGRVLTNLESILDDCRLISLGSQFMFNVHLEEVDSFIDILVFGSIQQMASELGYDECRPYFWQRRDAYYGTGKPLRNAV